MTLRTLLVLGRVSNLPTVWSNVLAGSVLAGASHASPSLLVAMLAMSSFYVGGMYLNDAFDREFDARHQPLRPIPSGRASSRSVFLLGFGLLALGCVGVAWRGWVSGRMLPALISAVALAALIVFYNVHHKGNRWSPLVMGLCRVFVYITSGLMLGGALTPSLAVGAVVLLSYLMVLTQIAKRGGGPSVVGLMLAGICVVDALALVQASQFGLAALAVLGFPLTRALHRWVPGT